MVESRPGGPAVPPEVLAVLIEAAPTVRELVDAYILATVEACGGNRKKAANRLGVGLATVYRRAGVGGSVMFSQNENLVQK